MTTHTPEPWRSEECVEVFSDTDDDQAGEIFQQITREDDDGEGGRIIADSCEDTDEARANFEL